MKKLLALALSLAAMGFSAVSGMAKTTSSSSIIPDTSIAANAAPQLRIQIGRDRRHDRYDRRDRDRYDRFDRVRTEQQTRIVQYGRRTFRETYLVRYFPNGTMQTTLI